MARYFIGVDWGDEAHQVYVEDEQVQPVLEKQVDNTPEGLGTFGCWLYECVAQGIELVAAIEKPEGRIVDFLLDHGVEVYPINPKTQDRNRDRYRTGNTKSDAFDAYVLADALRTDIHRRSPLAPNSSRTAELKMLTRDYRRLVNQQTRLINQLKAFGVFDINTEAEAISYEAITGSGYTQALDSWAYGPFDGIGPPPQFDETSTSYYVHAGTPGGVDVGATNLAYVVSDGNIGWDGTISRGGVDYDTSGIIPEPATMTVLGLGGLAMLLRRRG